MQKEEVDYIVVDFCGYYHWGRRDDGLYAVDPLFIEKFKEYLKKYNKSAKKQLL